MSPLPCLPLMVKTQNHHIPLPHSYFLFERARTYSWILPAELPTSSPFFSAEHRYITALSSWSQHPAASILQIPRAPRARLTHLCILPLHYPIEHQPCGPLEPWPFILALPMACHQPPDLRPAPATKLLNRRRVLRFPATSLLQTTTCLPPAYPISSSPPWTALHLPGSFAS